MSELLLINKFQFNPRTERDWDSIVNVIDNLFREILSETESDADDFAEVQIFFLERKGNKNCYLIKFNRFSPLEYVGVIVTVNDQGVVDIKNDEFIVEQNIEQPAFEIYDDVIPTNKIGRFESPEELGSYEFDEMLDLQDYIEANIDKISSNLMNKRIKFDGNYDGVTRISFIEKDRDGTYRFVVFAENEEMEIVLGLSVFPNRTITGEVMKVIDKTNLLN